MSLTNNQRSRRNCMNAIKYAKRTADYGDYVGANNVLETVSQEIVEDRVIAQDEIIRKAYADVSAQVKAGNLPYEPRKLVVFG